MITGGLADRDDNLTGAPFDDERAGPAGASTPDLKVRPTPGIYFTVTTTSARVDRRPGSAADAINL